MQSAVLKSSCCISHQLLTAACRLSSEQDFTSQRTPHDRQRFFGRRSFEQDGQRRTHRRRWQARAASERSLGVSSESATFYELLGVKQEATPEEIRAAYKLQKQRLADNTEGGAPKALESLEAAYLELAEEESRRLYDFGLANQTNAASSFVWPYEVDGTQRLGQATEQNFKDTADAAMLQGFDNDALSDDEQSDLTSDLLILGVILTLVISAILKLSSIGINSVQAFGDMAVEMWEELGP